MKREEAEKIVCSQADHLGHRIFREIAEAIYRLQGDIVFSGGDGPFDLTEIHIIPLNPDLHWSKRVE